MAKTADSGARTRFSLRDVPGTTLAVAGLTILGAAAIVSAPFAVWYCRKRKRADALAANPPLVEGVSSDSPIEESPGETRDPSTSD